MRCSQDLLVIALLLLLPVAANAQNPAKSYSDTVPLAVDGVVTIDNHEGSITVTTWDRAEVRYEARVEAERGADHSERTTVSINRSGRYLNLDTEYDAPGIGGFFGGQNIMPVHYTLTVPNTARLTIDDHESNIEVTGLQSELQIDTHEGPIMITGQQGNVEIDAHESPMRLRNVAGQVEIDSHEGKVSVENLRGGLEIDAHDVRADIAFASFEDDVSIDTHEGTFTLTLPSHAGFVLDTDFDDDATLRSDFDLSAIRLDDDDDDEVNYRGAVNGGGPWIRLSSHEGRFTLRAR